jgi:hypothetical protein
MEIIVRSDPFTVPKYGLNPNSKRMGRFVFFPLRLYSRGCAVERP